MNRHRRDAADEILIDDQLKERGFGLPVTIAPRTDRLGSAFFPITPSPMRLTVDYSNGVEMREVTVDLPELEGLHLKGKGPAGKARPPLQVTAGSDAGRPDAAPPIAQAGAVQ